MNGGGEGEFSMLTSQELADIVHEHAPSFRLRLSEKGVLERYPLLKGSFCSTDVAEKGNRVIVYEKDLSKYRDHTLVGFLFENNIGGDDIFMHGFFHCDTFQNLVMFVMVLTGL